MKHRNAPEHSPIVTGFRPRSDAETPKLPRRPARAFLSDVEKLDSMCKEFDSLCASGKASRFNRDVFRAKAVELLGRCKRLADAMRTAGLRTLDQRTFELMEGQLP